MNRVMYCLSVVFVVTLFTAQAALAQHVAFDNGHGERFIIGDAGPLQLSKLAEALRVRGAKVSALDRKISDASLDGIDALVISGAFAPLQPDEVEAVQRFMARGGKLAVMLHIAPPLASLLDSLGIDYTNGVIRENENVIAGNPQDFRSTRLGDHPVMKGIKEFSLYGVWGLRTVSNRSRIVASTSPKAWIDLHRDKVQHPDETASFGVAVAGEVGKGGFLVFGDDAIFQNKFIDGNMALATNLVGWLK
ncbi:DUF4350 domain-containing protein [Geomonas sp. Red276]